MILRVEGQIEGPGDRGHTEAERIYVQRHKLLEGTVLGSHGVVRFASMAGEINI